MSLSTAEAACVYAALILHDEDIEITSEKLASLIEAAGVEVESVWPVLFAKALKGKDVGEILSNVGAGGAAVAIAAAPAAAPAEAPGSPGKEKAATKKEEKKKEPEPEESDDDMGLGLFD
ncbi:hypothetical protein SeMB42_g00453 [Synchytrium endobioticum]|uniref:60S acidic ribosomal protein P1 n=1 Tax=Synchytrium endobioticum TaxID=286115 RepID=A0A507DJ02_9FUNG|nr:hypothetical protein SeLEV6574_g00317 [Synchytrium endobioticum]TPX54073.1 hypothetical protein SeMB42_g00453 [Synchytrium endobioticum]